MVEPTNEQLGNESTDRREQTRSNRTLVWVGGGVLFLLLFGCAITLAGGIFFMTVATPVERSAAPVREAVQVQEAPARLQATPRPAVVVQPPENGQDYETAVLANIYQQVNPSVVNVTVLGRGGNLIPSDEQAPPGFDEDGLFQFSSGSGFVWDEQGYVVTNNHVVEEADEVQITFADGTIAIADVVGTDVDSDLAVLRIEPDGYMLSPIRLGNIDDVYVGMRVAAIGNPFGLQGTLTSGIVSAMGRSIPARASFSIPDSIQTDAAINPGNSGGPLLNERGELIGVNAQIRSDVRANSGVGFAIPVSIVERVVPALIRDGVYEHAYIGISGLTFSPICADELNVSKELRGAVVQSVLERTPAERAGLRAGTRSTNTQYPWICPDNRGGDIITAIDGSPVNSFDDILIYLERFTSPGDTVTLTVLRDGEQIFLDLTLAARPR